MTRRNGKLVPKYGTIRLKYASTKTKEGGIVLNQFGMMIDSKPGDSGGIVISKKSEIIGVNNSSIRNTIIHASATKLNTILDVVYKRIEELTNHN